jgi:hypothetical protein
VNSPGLRDQTSGISDSLRPSTHCPKIHPYPAVCQLASVAATLISGKNSPSGSLREHEIVSRLWEEQLLFPTPPMSKPVPWLRRYPSTEFTSRFKSLLTLLELAVANLHHEKSGRDARSVDRYGG